MMSSTLRRRLHHGDVDGRRQEYYWSPSTGSLNEPFLSKREHDGWHQEENVSEGSWDGVQTKVQLHWTFVCSQVIAKWSQWIDAKHMEELAELIANFVQESSSVIGRLLPSASKISLNKGHVPPPLSPLQEERLRNLQRKLQVPFDGSKAEHQDALRQLWRLAYPNTELPSLKSVLWKEMGWQGTDPSTDFRGGGFISLENLIYFAKTYPESFQRLLHKRDGERAEWEYPFAIAGINISFMLTHLFDLRLEEPRSLAGIRFLKLLEEDENAFYEIFCVTFQIMDAEWLIKRASYMDFNDVLKSTRAQLERDLELEGVLSMRDLPAYYTSSRYIVNK